MCRKYYICHFRATVNFLVVMFLCLLRYEKEGRGRKTLKAQQLWYAIIESQTETGTPYMLYKDACNSKSNQQNLGTIRCSNLCTEIVEYCAPDEVGTPVCACVVACVCVCVCVV